MKRPDIRKPIHSALQAFWYLMYGTLGGVVISGNNSWPFHLFVLMTIVSWVVGTNWLTRKQPKPSQKPSKNRKAVLEILAH